jgi:hypothetical protein
MTVLSVVITESAEQVVSDIPRFVTISTNIPVTIFYTLDGSTPTLFSQIYTAPIEMPTSLLQVILSVFASNGIINSDIVVNKYQTVITGENARVPHSATDQPVGGLQDPYPFGSTPITPGTMYLGAAEAGLTVDNPLLPEYPSGFDGSGNPTGFTNEPLIGIPTKTQPILLSETNAQGETGPGIGTLPRSTIQSTPPPPEQQNFNDKLFDPRALVIFQDFTQPQDPNSPVYVNRMMGSLEDASTSRDGNQYYNTALENAGPTMTFLRQHYNPTDQTLTYYYRDFTNNRWIISKTPYTPAPDAGRYYNMVFSKAPGAGFVFAWLPFKANFLY